MVNSRYGQCPLEVKLGKARGEHNEPGVCLIAEVARGSQPLPSWLTSGQGIYHFPLGSSFDTSRAQSIKSCAPLGLTIRPFKVMIPTGRGKAGSLTGKTLIKGCLECTDPLTGRLNIGGIRRPAASELGPQRLLGVPLRCRFLNSPLLCLLRTLDNEKVIGLFPSPCSIARLERLSPATSPCGLQLRVTILRRDF